MTYEPLDTVVLVTDLPEHRLRAGDLGAVVQVYAPEHLEVEFVNGAGRTEALVTLHVTQLRPVQGDDLIAVRPLDKSA